MYRRATDLIRSSSSGEDGSGGKRKICFIVFADVHHSDTQIKASDNNDAIINDENDARLRKVAWFYGNALYNHLHDRSMDQDAEVVFLSDDVQSRKLALLEQPSDDNVADGVYYKARSMRQHVALLQKEDPTLHYSTNRSVDNASKEIYYSPHIDSSDLSYGLKSNRYYQGTYRSNRDSHTEGMSLSVVEKTELQSSLRGAMISIELKERERSGWRSAKESPEAGIAADTAEPTLKDIDNIAEEVAVDEEGQLRRLQESREEGRQRYASPHDVIAEKHEREHADGVTSTVVFFPIDNRIPPILLRTTQRDRLVGMRILVSIDSWPADSEYPLGHYVKTLGVTGTKDTETQVLLQEFRIPCEPFPAKVLACLPPADYKIELEPGRLDMRHLPVLSIDPPGCKDIDDALHCIELPNGNWQCGVHIADVTHYVEAGSAIDLEAANRSTSTYLVNKRLDMLPSLLTTDLCSLKGNVDRFAFSVLWEVTPEAEVVDVEFHKSIIHSIAALTYQQAQSLIDKPDKDCRDDIQAGAVKRLAVLARKFRERRIRAGALTLASPEVKFVLDSESLNPTDVQAYTLYEANALVEEFMLLANVTVSKKILRHYPTLSVLRRHPAPNRSMFDGLIQKARTKGVSICIDDSKKLADSLDEAGKKLSDNPYLDKLIRILSTRCMSPAQYFCSGEYQAKDWHHYGLAAPVYTHFTSPIRRYADVCVHRLLAAAIGVAPLPVFLSSKSHLHDLAANMNRRHRAAQLAGRASVQLHTLIFFAGGEEGEGGGAKEEDAYVLDVETSPNSEPSFTVMVPRYGIEGRVRLSHIAAKDDENLIRDPEKHRLAYKDAKSGKMKASVAVFDKVRVKIWVRSSRDRKELIVDLLEPRALADPTVLEEKERTTKKKKLKTKK
ncbi:exosome complex exonuclease RRP44 [Skeletonema marinoi]|uniref:Exosome complex exonuclease RRP44 n=1 Tax=Skeletonema marinoi TaxID=267567 RepID=A0AAD9D453_9STRA|nr:exosome complex exonuclease RRP44 [Skeletonema marinoi]